MGKASRWFRGLLGLKKPDYSPSSGLPPVSAKPPKRRWSFVKSYREKQTASGDDYRKHSGDAPHQTNPENTDDRSKHAIAVAAATAAVADAAVATAQAANAVVKLTSSGRSTTTSGGVNNTVAHVSISGFGIREEYAAVKIQSNFRAYLARRALKALKALVRLQALVRGHIMRKKTAYTMRGMQALIRAQARARIGRSLISDSPQSSAKSSQLHHPGPPTPEKFEHPMRAVSTKHQPSLFKRNGSISYAKVGYKIDGPTDEGKGDKILEIDTGKPHMMPKRRNLFHSSHHASSSEQNSHSHSHSHSFTTSRCSTMHQTVPSPSSCEVNSLSPLIYAQDLEEMSFCTAENSPQFYSASSKGNSSMRGPFAPCKSDGSRSCLSGYSDHPNYMSFTESSKAKIRSLSAPRQRPQYEISGITKRYSVYGYGDARLGTQRVSAMHANFASKAYPGSGRLDRLGMPVGGGGCGDVAEFSGGFWNRY